LAHLPVLSKMRGAQLVAICDNDRPKARALADRFGVPDTFTDIEDLLESGELDAVIVATPNHLHEPHVLAALAAKVETLLLEQLALLLCRFLGRSGVAKAVGCLLGIDVVVLVAHVRLLSRPDPRR
jgi:hypothetical protein